jgi:hypothetical protein
MLNRLGLNGTGEAGQRDPGSNNSNYLNDGTDADAMAETRERIGGSLSTHVPRPFSAEAVHTKRKRARIGTPIDNGGGTSLMFGRSSCTKSGLREGAGRA